MESLTTDQLGNSNYKQPSENLYLFCPRDVSYQISHCNHRRFHPLSSCYQIILTRAKGPDYLKKPVYPELTSARDSRPENWPRLVGTLPTTRLISFLGLLYHL